MAHSTDMATALDLNLDESSTAKFLALKNLYSKKLKSLMSSVDTKDKEIAKMKMMEKDNRRSQMIQVLKDKVSNLEVIIDILKVELERQSDYSKEDINNMIIKKTLDGPKTIRPLTREEMENKISELERKLNRAKGAASQSGMSRTTEQIDNESKASPAPSKISYKFNDEPAEEKQQGSTIHDLIRFADLMNDMEGLKMTIGAKEGVIVLQREEIVRLRARISELSSMEEEMESKERQFHDLKVYNKTLLENLEEKTRQLAEALELSNNLKGDVQVQYEHQKSELQQLHKQCEKQLKQNRSLLQKLQDMELELEKFTQNNQISEQNTKITNSELSLKDEKINSLEQKLTKTTKKLNDVENKYEAIQVDLNQITVLKNQLREKNIEIKDLKRLLDSKEKLKIGKPTLNDNQLAAEKIDKESDEANFNTAKSTPREGSLLDSK